jgi:hypothetical protein
MTTPYGIRLSQYIFEGVVGLIADFDEEGMHSIILIVDVELCEYGAHVGEVGCSSDPEFHGHVVRRVQDEAFTLSIENRCC